MTDYQAEFTKLQKEVLNSKLDEKERKRREAQSLVEERGRNLPLKDREVLMKLFNISGRSYVDRIEDIKRNVNVLLKYERFLKTKADPSKVDRNDILDFLVRLEAQHRNIKEQLKKQLSINKKWVAELQKSKNKNDYENSIIGRTMKRIFG